MNKCLLSILIVAALLFCSCKGRMYRQPTGSMEETIMMGESFYTTSTKDFKRNDIVVFDYWGEDYTRPLEEPGMFEMSWQKWVKRLIAFSGDTLDIKDGDVFINGNLVTPPPGCVTEYDVFSLAQLNDFPERQEWQQAMLLEMKGDTFHYTAHLTRDQAADYQRRRSAVLNVKKRLISYSTGDTSVINPCDDCRWTVDDFGPLKIPSPGDTITVKTENFRLYKNVEGIHAGKNIIREKLYFVLGDNRHASQDSRYMGYISHSKMVGVVK